MALRSRASAWVYCWSFDVHSATCRCTLEMEISSTVCQDMDSRWGLLNVVFFRNWRRAEKDILLGFVDGYCFKDWRFMSRWACVQFVLAKNIRVWGLLCCFVVLLRCFWILELKFRAGNSLSSERVCRDFESSWGVEWKSLRSGGDTPLGNVESSCFLGALTSSYAHTYRTYGPHRRYTSWPRRQFVGISQRYGTHVYRFGLIVVRL